jgi:hypothetical protein
VVHDSELDTVVLVRYAPGRVGEEPDDEDALKEACVELLSLVLVLTLIPVVEVCAKVFAVWRFDELIIDACVVSVQ